MIGFALDGYALLRFCGASVLLLGIYYGLYDRKACFLHCRYYLLLMVLAAALISVVRIPVYDSGREFVVISGRPGEVVEGAVGMPEASLREEKVGGGAGDITSVVAEEETWETKGAERSLWQVDDVLFLIYGVVAFIFLLRWLLAVASIFRLKRWGSCDVWEGVLVVRNNRVASPFSFFRMIFVNRKLQGETLRVVLAHEKTHIEHKHYRDTLMIEMFCIFFWFNPFVWLVKRELKALHEFEVDRYLLNHGLELSKYQNIIFNELMGYGPVIANGFHNSMIKKRFIMMKTVSDIRYGFLRKVMLLPAVAGLMALFAFTDKETVKERIWLPFMEEVRMEEVAWVNNALPDESDGAGTGRMEVVSVALPDKRSGKVGDTVAMMPQVVVADSVKKAKSVPFKGREGFTFYPLEEDQLVVSLLPFVGTEKIKYIETDKDETRVTILVPIYYESNWVQFNKGFCMVDKASGDTYVIRSMTRGVELNKTYSVEGKKNRMVEFTMVFPPLKKGVKVISLYQKYPDMGTPMPSNGSESCFKDVRVSDYLPPKNLDQYYDKEGRPKTVRKVEYVGLRDDQVVVSRLPFERKTRIKSIETLQDETRLTIAVPIWYDYNWVHFSKGFCMEDCRTGDVYQVRSMDRGIEFNKTLVVKGQKGKMVEFTMIFPKLKKKVKRVNIFLKYPEETGLAPTNAAEDWNWRKVRLSDYQKETGQIYY